jgi:hypothetical protein
VTTRYTQQTQPDLAGVAQPVRSPFAALAGAASQVIGAVHTRLDDRARGLELAALSGARRELETQGLALEMELRKGAGPAGAGHVPQMQTKRKELVDKIWAGVPESVRNSERAQLAWTEIRDQDQSAATRRATLWQSEQETAFATESLQAGLNALTARIEAAPDTAETELAQWRASLPTYAGLIGEDAVRRIDDASARDIMLASVRGLGKAGRFEDAEALIAKIAGSLGVDQRESASTWIEQEQRAQQGTAAEAYQLRIQRGELTLADIDDAGDIDDGQKATLRAQLQGRTADTLAKDVAAGKTGKRGIDAAEAAGEINTGQGNALRAQNLAMIEKAKRELEIERARQAQERIDRQNGNAETLEYQILQGNLGEADAFVALQNGDIGMGHFNALSRMAQQGSAGRAKAAGVMARLAAGSPLDPYDADTRSGMDTIWEANGGTLLFTREVVTATGADGSPAMTANAGTQAVLNTARQAGVIPPAAASSLQGMASNGSDQQKQVALDTVALLFDQFPAAAAAAFPDGQDRILKDAISWKLKVGAGIDPVEALRAVERENVAPSDPVLKQRRTDGQKAALELGAGDVRKALTTPGMIPFFDNVPPPMSPDVEAGAVAMLREVYETEFLRTGDPAVAKATAQAAVKRIVGPTTVGGTNTAAGTVPVAASTMAYPPERYYAPGLAEAKPGWLTAQLVGDVQDMIDGGALPGAPPGTQISGLDVRIVSDAVTASQVRGGEMPSYVVLFRGAPLEGRYQFDPTAPLAAAMAEGQDKLRIGERKRAMVESGIFQPDEAQELAKRVFPDQAAFDALTVGRTGPAKTVPGIGLRRPERDGNALWQRLQGIDSKYALPGGEGG